MSAASNSKAGVIKSSIHHLHETIKNTNFYKFTYNFLKTINFSHPKTFKIEGN